MSAAGDTVYEFAGNGAGAGDLLQLVGYGKVTQGATFIQETITLAGAPTIDATDYLFI